MSYRPMVEKTCEAAQELRTYMRDISMDHHPVQCCSPNDVAPCPFLEWKRGDEGEWYDATYGPIEPCDCCDSCRASCAKDVDR